ncbi:MAG TPA: hypothetical protein VI653_03930, partial [Steroidobacteraceae bacterium]
MAERNPGLTILTGAGASVPLGLPTMNALMPAAFADQLSQGERDVFEMAANWATLQSPAALDFEYLFTGVDLIAKLDVADDLAMAFAPPRPSSGGATFQFKSVSGSAVQSNLEGYRKDA